MRWIENLKMGVRARHYRNHENPREIAYILDNLKKGEVAIDIGANKGGFLYWMARSVGPKGRAIGFEPQRFLFEFLSDFYSNKPQVKIEHEALSDKAETVTMIIPENGKTSSPGASIHFTTADNPSARTEEVTTESLDSYCAANKIIPNLVKIDVEGHELKVVKGAAATFAAHKPRVILECEAMQVGKELVNETLSFLLSLGYNGFFYFNGNRTDIREFDPETHQPSSFSGKKRNVYVSNFFFE
jgi:FkbM family methyltransferase